MSVPGRTVLGSPGRALALAATVVGAATLVACSPDSGDFSNHAESLIEDQNSAVADALDVSFSDAECEEPERLVDGEIFTCTADGDDGNRWLFTAIVTSDRDYRITEAEIDTPPVEIRAETTTTTTSLPPADDEEDEPAGDD